MPRVILTQPIASVVGNTFKSRPEGSVYAATPTEAQRLIQRGIAVIETAVRGPAEQATAIKRRPRRQQPS